MAYASGLQRQALYSIGLALFLFVLVLNVGLRRLWKGRREDAS
jgi:phosphate transport system permease protein